LKRLTFVLPKALEFFFQAKIDLLQSFENPTAMSSQALAVQSLLFNQES
jgi:hypothetical protein